MASLSLIGPAYGRNRLHLDLSFYVRSRSAFLGLDTSGSLAHAPLETPMRKRKQLEIRLTAEEIKRVGLITAALDGRLGEQTQKLAREAIAQVIGKKEWGFGRPACGNA